MTKKRSYYPERKAEASRSSYHPADLRCRSIARNTLWNLIGSGAPILVSLLTIPVLINTLGPERFGLLTIAWMLIGYVNLFDFGLGRALTKVVAERQGTEWGHEIPPLFWTTLGLMLLLSLVAMTVFLWVSPWLVHRVLKVPAPIRVEAEWSFFLLATAIPVTITTAGLRGFLEARQQFLPINLVRIIMGLFTYVAPVLVLPLSHSLVAVVAVLLLGRVVTWVAHLVLCLRLESSLLGRPSISGTLVVPLLWSGGWMTASNIISPLMVMMDRLLVGYLVSLAAVAYYATPFDVIMRMLIIPGALAGVVFPTIATVYSQDRGRAGRLFDRAARLTLLIMLPLVLFVIVFAREGLGLWLGAEFARRSTRVLQWLAAGVLANGLSQIPFASIQGAGRADLTAKFHLLELPVYLVAIWWLIRVLGIEGAAIASALRMGLDMVLLFTAARRLLPAQEAVAPLVRLAPWVFSCILAAALAAALPVGAAGRLILGAVLLAGSGVGTWFLVLDKNERDYALRIMAT